MQGQPTPQMNNDRPRVDDSLCPWAFCPNHRNKKEGGQGQTRNFAGPCSVGRYSHDSVWCSFSFFLIFLPNLKVQLRQRFCLCATCFPLEKPRERERPGIPSSTTAAHYLRSAAKICEPGTKASSARNRGSSSEAGLGESR